MNKVTKVILWILGVVVFIELLIILSRILSSGDILTYFLLFWIIFIGICIGLSVFWIIQLVDCIKREKFKSATKVVWIILIIALGHLGAFLYYFMEKKNHITKQ